MRVLLIATLGTVLLAGCTPAPYDNTDDQLNGIRSGFTIKKDYGTGCEYLVFQSGGGRGAAMSIRYGWDGRPMCGGVKHGRR